MSYKKLINNRKRSLQVIDEDEFQDYTVKLNAVACPNQNHDKCCSGKQAEVVPVESCHDHHRLQQIEADLALNFAKFRVNITKAGLRFFKIPSNKFVQFEGESFVLCEKDS